MIALLIALGVAALPQDLATLEKKLRSSDERERQQAVRQLAELKTRPAWEAVIGALKDISPRVADEAELRLRAIDEEPLVKLLLGKDGVRHSDAWVQVHAAGALAGSTAASVPRAWLWNALEARSDEARAIVLAGIERLAHESRLGAEQGRHDAQSLEKLAAARKEGAQVRAAALLAAAAVRGGTPQLPVLEPTDPPELLCAKLQLAGAERSEAARKLLESALRHPQLAVRAQVARVCAAQPDARTLGLLVTLLEAERNQRLAWTIAEELERLTGLRHGIKHEYWRRWCDNLGSDWKPVTGARRSEPSATGTSVLYGMPVLSSQVTILVDFSGSLWEPRQDGRTRKQLADEELEQTLEALPPQTRFNLIPYTAEPIPWEQRLVPATPQNVERALAFFKGLKASGKGNLWSALELALADPDVDTLLVLTDGAPTGGRRWDLELMKERFLERNRFRHVVLDAVLVDSGRFLQERWREWCEATGGRMKSVALD